MIRRVLSTIHVNFNLFSFTKPFEICTIKNRAYDKMVMADHKRNGMKKYLIVSSF